MFKLATPFFIIVESPLHAGSGSDLGVVDLPIQRERHTDFPKIEGSGLKGSIREAFEETPTSKKSELIDTKNGDDFDIAVHLAFGYDEAGYLSDKVKENFEDREKQQFSGALGFTDARILLFPVKSMRGVFAWVTCPKVIERFKKDLSFCNCKNSFKIPNPASNKCVIINNNEVKSEICVNNKYVILEEYTFEVEEKKDANKDLLTYIGYIDTEIHNRLVILNDNDFKDFVNLSTEVITRTKIDNKTGTVGKGQLFTEEYLPTETILYSLALTSPIFHENKGIFELTAEEKENCTTEAKKVMEFFTRSLPKVMQIGGNATIGKGIVRMKVFFNKEEQNNGE